MALQDKLNEHKANFEKNAPPEALEVMHRATVDLRNSGDTAGGKNEVVGYGSYVFS
jgi:hypothetical protein